MKKVCGAPPVNDENEFQSIHNEKGNKVSNNFSKNKQKSHKQNPTRRLAMSPLKFSQCHMSQLIMEYKNYQQQNSLQNYKFKNQSKVLKLQHSSVDIEQTQIKSQSYNIYYDTCFHGLKRCSRIQKTYVVACFNQNK